jgi:hypothetical protein
MICLISTGLLAACSVSIGSNNLNTDKLETEIENGIEDQVQISGITVDCPDDVEIEEGNDFECTAKDDQGNERSVDVTQTDDEGNVEWKLAD